MDAPRGDDATAWTGEGRARVATRGRPVENPPTRAFLSTTARPRFAWFTGDASVAVRGAAATITGSGAGRFEQVRKEADRLFETCDVPDSVPPVARPRLFGGFAFHEGAAKGRWDGFDDATFVLPAVQLTGTDDGWWLTVAAAGPDAASEADRRLARWHAWAEETEEAERSPPPGVTGRGRTPSRSGWRDQVGSALERVAAGDLEKVVLAQALTLTLGEDVRAADVLERLGERYPDCYRFAFTPPDAGTFFGATPERLVSLDGRTVRTEALAGSTGRGDTPAEDEWLAADLLDSDKDAHEHRLVVDAIRDQLDPYAASVRTNGRTVRRLATVQHLRTSITAELADDEHVLTLASALHPTPAVGGLPPEAARRTIRDTETFDRGWYAAPIGWFDAAGNGTFAVAIRSALARGRDATLFAGAGIVGDSDPDREWEEVQLKYRPILDELQ